MVDSNARRISRVEHSERTSERAPERTAASRERALAAQSLGAALRERREAMGVSLAEVEIATRIRQKYLSAIEADEWHLLPGEVVGRGFLRNYAEYLGLESHEINDRRRAVTDAGLTAALATTSAGAPLPPERAVDYRPKEVELKDEVDGIERGEIKLTPILSILAIAALVALVGWGLLRLRQPIGDMMASVRTQVNDAMTGDAPTATPGLIGIVNADNTGVQAAAALTPAEGGVAQPPAGGGSGDPSAAGQTGGESGGAVLALIPTDTPTVAPLPPTNTPEAPALEPTATFTPEPPTPEPPTPVPPTPEPPTPEPPTPEPELPTETPVPPAPQVFAPSCAEVRSALLSPGVNQVLSGVVGLSGTAEIDAFDYFKLEFAPGANAGGGFVYFGGQSNPVSGGQLGALDTTSLPNGEYTLRLTVVDQTGNYLTPCDVSVVIQN